MKKILSVLLSVLLVMSTFTFAASALTQDEANETLASAVTEFNALMDNIDVSADGNITTSDAQAILQYSAGLTTTDASKADVDGDGNVTAIDARMVLRYAANLESVDYLYTADMKITYFNAIINSIKANGYAFYSCTANETVDVTYDNSTLVDEFTSQMNALMSKLGDDSTIDFGEELTSEAGSVSYSSSTKTAATSSNFPLTDDELASYLTTDNIVAVEFKEDQSYTYAQYSSTGGYVRQTYTSNTVEGLDTITVYIKTDGPMTTIPDSSTLNHSKVFNLVTQDIIDSVDDASDYLGDMSGLEDFGTFEMSASFGSLTYYDSYVTIYFNPDTGIPIATEYSLNYDLITSFYMNIAFNRIGEWAGYGLNVKGTINLTSTMKDTSNYCFYKADPDNLITRTSATT